MIVVSRLSLLLAEVSITYWFVYFQYYWFPQLQPQPFTGYCFLQGLIYAGVHQFLLTYPQRAWFSALPALVLVVIELGMLTRDQRRYLPAFFNVTFLAYLLTEFIDTVCISVLIGLTNLRFATSLKGTVAELVFANVIFALLVLALWQTQAPMENLIHGMLGHVAEVLMTVFMLCLAICFLLLESTIQLLHLQPNYVLFFAGVLGTLLLGLSMSAYLLMQAYLQRIHAQTQLKQQAFQVQYNTELNRQMAAIRKFRHDYQNMLLGLGGYLDVHDYQGFRQLYIDIRSGWATSNAADLTIDDLGNMPRGPVRYDLYHDYLMAQRLGVDLFVEIPKPLTATVVVGRQMGTLLTRSLPRIITAVAPLHPAMVTLKITEGPGATWLQVTFPVPENARVVGNLQMVAPEFQLDLAGLLQGLPRQATSQLRVKLHWGQLLVMLPMD